MIEGEESKISKTFHYAFQDSTSHRQKKKMCRGNFVSVLNMQQAFLFCIPSATM